MKVFLYINFLHFLIISSLHSSNNPIEKRIVKFTKRKLIFTKNVNDEVDEEILKMCTAECIKLSKIYGCYCDPDCGKYGDCCNINIHKCENYFEEMKKGQQYGSKKSHKGKSANNNNKDNNNNLQSSVIAIRGGSCCSESEPIGCFCDSKCNLFGDCCEDYQKCENKSDPNKRNRLSGGINNKNLNKTEVKNTTFVGDYHKEMKVRLTNSSFSETADRNKSSLVKGSFNATNNFKNLNRTKI
jgi:hypothetical protein